MQEHYNLPWVKLMKSMIQAHPSGTKPRDYPNAPQDRAFTMDFSPGYDTSLSRYTFMEGNHYDTGFNPFEPEVYETEHRDELEAGHHIYLRHFAKGEHLGHAFGVKREPNHRLAKGESSYYSESPSESEEAQQHLMREHFYTPLPGREKKVRRTAPQMLAFFGHKGIDPEYHTPTGLKVKLTEMGLNDEYQQYVKEKRDS